MEKLGNLICTKSPPFKIQRKASIRLSLTAGSSLVRKWERKSKQVSMPSVLLKSINFIGSMMRQWRAVRLLPKSIIRSCNSHAHLIGRSPCPVLRLMMRALWVRANDIGEPNNLPLSWSVVPRSQRRKGRVIFYFNTWGNVGGTILGLWHDE